MHEVAQQADFAESWGVTVHRGVASVGNLTRKTQHSQYAPKWARQIDNEPGTAEREDRQALAGHLLRRLEPEIVEYPEPPTGRLERRFSVSGLVVASIIGATIVVAVIDAPRWTSELGVGTNAVVRRGDNSARSAKQRAPQNALQGSAT